MLKHIFITNSRGESFSFVAQVVKKFPARNRVKETEGSEPVTQKTAIGIYPDPDGESG
jgi:hypothetical protein